VIFVRVDFSDDESSNIDFEICSPIALEVRFSFETGEVVLLFNPTAKYRLAGNWLLSRPLGGVMKSLLTVDNLQVVFGDKGTSLPD
jgi:hypothetical protein|tara:strand:+ start:318 stop:575 length:258 start_codon:yes stop_codon:yes gene_type:complete